jgi:hypothetical protein
VGVYFLGRGTNRILWAAQQPEASFVGGDIFRQSTSDGSTQPSPPNLENGTYVRQQQQIGETYTNHGATAANWWGLYNKVRYWKRLPYTIVNKGSYAVQWYPAPPWPDKIDSRELFATAANLWDLYRVCGDPTQWHIEENAQCNGTGPPTRYSWFMVNVTWRQWSHCIC